MSIASAIGDGVRGEARRYGSLWSHLTADTEEELHVFEVAGGLSIAELTGFTMT